MDFFEAQEAARRRTALLIALFGAAVLAIVGVVYGVAHVAIGPGGGAIDVGLLITVALGVGLVVALGTGIRTASLRRGGPAVAELMGGRRVAPDTSDPDERRLLNIVEEMSLASGIPIPAIYVMDREDGINAFAAGHTTHDAAIAVTRGALRAFTRDELQGVVAHEYSHILNGDMRLNIRLIGVLYGILLLAVIGRGIVWSAPRGGGRRGGKDGGAGWIVLLGFALLLVGYIGVCFGKLIKAAVSRQREYLADSAAVQFTRNPDGIAGALKKIGASAHGSRMADAHAEELSHLFFANGLRRNFIGMLSTHPPLEERIRRLDPSWSGDFAEVPARRVVEEHRPAARRHGFEAAAGGPAGAMFGAAGLVASVGAPTPEHIAYARALLESLPEELTRAVHEPAGAEAMLLALVVSGTSEDARAGALQRVDTYGGAELGARVRRLMPLVEEQGGNARLPLVDLALPALETLSPAEAASLRGVVEEIVRSDGRVRTFEYALVHTLARRLSAESTRAAASDRTGPALDRREAQRVILSAMAWAGAEGDPAGAERAFAAGAERLGAGGLPLLEPGRVGLADVDAALDTLEDADRKLHRRLLEACAAAAARDGELRPTEAEILRAVAESLDCPMPPILA